MTKDGLPPHAPDVEAAALGCVLLAGNEGNQNEVDALLRQLRPSLFYDQRHRALHDELALMRMGEAPHNVSMVTLVSWVRGREPLFGGLEYMAGLPDKTAGLSMFPEYRRQLMAFARRRWAIGQSAKLSDKAAAGDIDLVELRNEFRQALDKIDLSLDHQKPLIELLTIQDAKAFKPEPKSFIVGAELICAGEMSVLAGWQGLGKTRLANTLAFAGARGTGTWMCYEVRRPFRTLILQSEASVRRIQMECHDVPDTWADSIRWSKPMPLLFSRPEFRQEIQRIYETWPFDILQVDNWLDIVRDDSVADYMEALDNIRASLPKVEMPPHVMIVAHLRKQRGGEKWQPRTGRELVHELVGSYALSAKARTIFIIQPGSMDMEDPTIIFETAKTNNDLPMAPSAWQRANVEFRALPDFDLSSWRNGNGESPRAARPEKADFAALFKERGTGMTKGTLVKTIIGQRDCSTAAAYKWVDKAIADGWLSQIAGILSMNIGT